MPALLFANNEPVELYILKIENLKFISFNEITVYDISKIKN